MNGSGRTWARVSLLIPLAFGGACSEDELLNPGDSLLKVAPARIDFGDVAVLGEASMELELRNAGTIPLELTGAHGDGLGDEFRWEGLPSRLGPGARGLAKLRFTPMSAGPRQGALIFETSSLQAPTVGVDVMARAVEPALIAQPITVDFGRVVVGKTKTERVRLSNTGDRTANVSGALLDATAFDFSVALDRVALEPGAHAELAVTYAPGNVGGDETRVTVVEDSIRSTPLTIAIRGEGVASDIVVEPGDIVFSGLYVGERQVKPFFLRNIGTDPHTIVRLFFASSGGMTASELRIDSASLPSPSFTLAAGDSRQVDVVYEPSNDQMDVDQIQVESTGLPAPAVVDVTGLATNAPEPAVEVTPQILNFGQVEVGQSKPLDLEIENAGTAALGITASATVSPSNAPYAIFGGPQAGQALRPLDLVRAQVVFSPRQGGLAPPAEVVVRSDDPRRPIVRVSLVGEGTLAPVPGIYVDPNPLDFGAVPRGVAASRPMLLRNDGSAPLTLGIIRLSQDAGGRFSLSSTPAPGTTLAPSQALTFAVSYSDNGAIATYGGMLEIASNDPDGTVLVPITARTDPPPPSMTDISVTLTWSSTAADVDVHLIRANGAFFDSPDDCCFCNPNPDWGVIGQAQDSPFLDRDDLFGPGPENINLTTAETGEYEVVVHVYNDRGHGPVDVSVQAQLRGTVVRTRTAQMQNMERWIAGRIQWDAAARSGTWRDGILGPFFTLFLSCF